LSVTLLAVALGGAGCKCIMANTGDMMADYTVEHLNPFMIGFGDLGMACELAQSVGGQLLSFERITDAPNKAAVGVMASAGICAEVEAWDAELSSLRALKRGDAPGAKDGRLAEKRKHAVAAWRFKKAGEYLAKAYPVKAGECPELETTEDEFTWLMGNIAAVQAVQHDRVVGGAVGVPLDLPRQAARNVRCVNNERWWGVPAALEAAVWTGIPGAAPEGADPWGQMAKASAEGKQTGVRLALAIRAQAAAAAGRMDEVRTIIREFKAAGAEFQPPARWLLMDRNAEAQLLALSDRLWTEATGHRTPEGALGTFWDDEVEAGGDDDLLDDLGGAAPTDEAPAADGGADE
ncbi:MAG: hypothetical protein KC613_05575, partial [Myxococcales bacterium]|nr:hypothetical protein [Myxococcales bacterium]